jgi:carboxymethylenebutenolidase
MTGADWESYMSNTARISTLDGEGTFDCYLARPDGEATAAIVVIQEIFGVNAGIRRKCDRLAEAGYLALAPDLFWRLEPGVELDPDVEGEFKAALELMGRFDQDLGVRDIEAAIRYARNSLNCDKVGAVGYCLGGRLAYMTASVGYYAVGIDSLLREKHAIAKPLMLHIPTADGFVPPEVQRAMHEGLEDHPRVTLHDYEGLDHGFATEMGKRRNDEGAELADRRTMAFFAEHLG